jgi:dihydrofolate reductase (trimethoprim resistance protein)
MTPYELLEAIGNCPIDGTLLPDLQRQAREIVYARKFTIGDSVRKTKGSHWHGKVVGMYSTELTPEGYAVESFSERGSVQIYPAAALELAQAAHAPASDDARQIEDLPPDERLAVLRRNRERLSAMGVVFQTEEDLQRIGNSPALPAPGALAGLVDTLENLRHKWQGGVNGRLRLGMDRGVVGVCLDELEAAIRAGVSRETG